MIINGGSKTQSLQEGGGYKLRTRALLLAFSIAIVAYVFISLMLTGLADEYESPPNSYDIEQRENDAHLYEDKSEGEAAEGVATAEEKFGEEIAAEDEEEVVTAEGEEEVVAAEGEEEVVAAEGEEITAEGKGEEGVTEAEVTEEEILAEGKAEVEDRAEVEDKAEGVAEAEAEIEDEDKAMIEDEAVIEDKAMIEDEAGEKPEAEDEVGEEAVEESEAEVEDEVDAEPEAETVIEDEAEIEDEAMIEDEADEESYEDFVLSAPARFLVCDIKESEAHTHSSGCYIVLVCGHIDDTEHIHTVECCATPDKAPATYRRNLTANGKNRSRSSETASGSAKPSPSSEETSPSSEGTSPASAETSSASANPSPANAETSPAISMTLLTVEDNILQTFGEDNDETAEETILFSLGGLMPLGGLLPTEYYVNNLFVNVPATTPSGQKQTGNIGFAINTLTSGDVENLSIRVSWSGTGVDYIEDILPGSRMTVSGLPVDFVYESGVSCSSGGSFTPGDTYFDLIIPTIGTGTGDNTGFLENLTFTLQYKNGLTPDGVAVTFLPTVYHEGSPITSQPTPRPEFNYKATALADLIWRESAGRLATDSLTAVYLPIRMWKWEWSTLWSANPVIFLTSGTAAHAINPAQGTGQIWTSQVKLTKTVSSSGSPTPTLTFAEGDVIPRIAGKLLNVMNPTLYADLFSPAASCSWDDGVYAYLLTRNGVAEFTLTKTALIPGDLLLSEMIKDISFELAVVGFEADEATAENALDAKIFCNTAGYYIEITDAASAWKPFVCTAVSADVRRQYDNANADDGTKSENLSKSVITGEYGALAGGVGPNREYDCGPISFTDIDRYTEGEYVAFRIYNFGNNETGAISNFTITDNAYASELTLVGFHTGVYTVAPAAPFTYTVEYYSGGVLTSQTVSSDTNAWIPIIENSGNLPGVTLKFGTVASGFASPSAILDQPTLIFRVNVPGSAVWYEKSLANKAYLSFTYGGLSHSGGTKLQADASITVINPWVMNLGLNKNATNLTDPVLRSNGPFFPGDLIEYEIIVKNNDQRQLTEFIVTDFMDLKGDKTTRAGLLDLSAVAMVGGSMTVNGETSHGITLDSLVRSSDPYPNDNKFIWTFSGSLAPGEEFRFKYTVQIASEALVTESNNLLYNKFYVRWPVNGGIFGTGPWEDGHGRSLADGERLISLAISKPYLGIKKETNVLTGNGATSATPIQLGDPVTFTVTVANQPDNNVITPGTPLINETVILYDALPKGIDVPSPASPLTNYGLNVAKASNNTAAWSLGNVSVTLSTLSDDRRMIIFTITNVTMTVGQILVFDFDTQSSADINDYESGVSVLTNSVYLDVLDGDYLFYTNAPYAWGRAAEKTPPTGTPFGVPSDLKIKNQSNIYIRRPGFNISFYKEVRDENSTVGDHIKKAFAVVDSTRHDWPDWTSGMPSSLKPEGNYHLYPNENASGIYYFTQTGNRYRETLTNGMIGARLAFSITLINNNPKSVTLDKENAIKISSIMDILPIGFNFPNDNGIDGSYVINPGFSYVVINDVKYAFNNSSNPWSIKRLNSDVVQADGIHKMAEFEFRNRLSSSTPKPLELDGGDSIVLIYYAYYTVDVVSDKPMWSGLSVDAVNPAYYRDFMNYAAIRVPDEIADVIVNDVPSTHQGYLVDGKTNAVLDQRGWLGGAAGYVLESRVTMRILRVGMKMGIDKKVIAVNGVPLANPGDTPVVGPGAEVTWEITLNVGDEEHVPTLTRRTYNVKYDAVYSKIALTPDYIAPGATGMNTEDQFYDGFFVLRLKNISDLGVGYGIIDVLPRGFVYKDSYITSNLHLYAAKDTTGVVSKIISHGREMSTSTTVTLSSFKGLVRSRYGPSNILADFNSPTPYQCFIYEDLFCVGGPFDNRQFLNMQYIEMFPAQIYKWSGEEGDPSEYIETVYPEFKMTLTTEVTEEAEWGSAVNDVYLKSGIYSDHYDLEHVTSQDILSGDETELDYIRTSNTVLSYNPAANNRYVLHSSAHVEVSDWFAVRSYKTVSNNENSLAPYTPGGVGGVNDEFKGTAGYPLAGDWVEGASVKNYVDLVHGQYYPYTLNIENHSAGARYENIKIYDKMPLIDDTGALLSSVSRGSKWIPQFIGIDSAVIEHSSAPDTVLLAGSGAAGSGTYKIEYSYDPNLFDKPLTHTYTVSDGWLGAAPNPAETNPANFVKAFRIVIDPNIKMNTGDKLRVVAIARAPADTVVPSDKTLADAFIAWNSFAYEFSAIDTSGVETTLNVVGANALEPKMVGVRLSNVGEITIVKTENGGNAPALGGRYVVKISLDGASPPFTQSVELNDGNSFTSTFKDLPAGTYTVTETMAYVDGIWRTASDYFMIETTDASTSLPLIGGKTTLTVSAPVVGVAVDNTAKPPKVEIYKMAKYDLVGPDSPMPNIRFELYSYDGSVYTLAGYAITNYLGYALIDATGVKSGETYYLVECVPDTIPYLPEPDDGWGLWKDDSAIDGYIRFMGPEIFLTTDNIFTPYRVDVLNIPDTGGFRVKKTYADGIAAPPPGTVYFEIVELLSSPPEHSHGVKAVETSHIGLVAEWFELPPGPYRIYEYTDPRYAPVDNYGNLWTFEGIVSDSLSPQYGLAKYRYDGELIWVTTGDLDVSEMVVKNIGLTGSVELQKMVEKRDSFGVLKAGTLRAALPSDDFTFSIEGPYGYYSIATVDSGGKLIFDDLPFGTYVITEIDGGVYLNDAPTLTITLPDAYSQSGGSIGAATDNSRVELKYAYPGAMVNYTMDGTGEITISKQVFSLLNKDVLDDYGDYTFTIGVFGPNDPDAMFASADLNYDNNYEATISDVPYGAYVVKEMKITGSGDVDVPVTKYKTEYWRVMDTPPDVSLGTGSFYVDGDTNNELFLLVKNTERFGFALPDAGASGIWPFAVGGSLLMLLAPGVVALFAASVRLARRRKRKKILYYRAKL